MLNSSTKNEYKKKLQRFQRFFIFSATQAEKPPKSRRLCAQKLRMHTHEKKISLTIDKSESINHHQLTLFSQKKNRRFHFSSDQVVSYKTLESLIVSQRQVG
jgi:hypothetical protein